MTLRTVLALALLTSCAAPPVAHQTAPKTVTQPADSHSALSAFKAAFGADDNFDVTDKGDHFEIIVSHPSTESETGGAEQYFLDKKTGKWRMGWHEHPMRLQ